MENPHEQTHNALLSRIINNMVRCIGFNSSSKLETAGSQKQKCNTNLLTGKLEWVGSSGKQILTADQ